MNTTENKKAYQGAIMKGKLGKHIHSGEGVILRVLQNTLSNKRENK